MDQLIVARVRRSELLRLDEPRITKAYPKIGPHWRRRRRNHDRLTDSAERHRVFGRKGDLARLSQHSFRVRVRAWGTARFVDFSFPFLRNKHSDLFNPGGILTDAIGWR